ncbi:MAG: GGDEF domain-containing protein [Burkholderiales bacterium]|nr:GGDEF domain-containing protein [Burkholderiales bacterium]
MLNRTKEEVILLMLCGLSIPSILPFGIYRLIQKNWLMASVDISIVVGMLCLMVFVWRTRRIRAAGIAVTLFYSAGMLAAVAVKGPPIAYWVYPTMIASYFILQAGEAMLINCVSLTILIYILQPLMRTLDLASLVVTLILINLFSYIFSYRTSIQHKELNFQAENDFLTGVRNRRSFDRQMQQLCDEHAADMDVCLLVLDLDHFKNINDQFGHSVGDQVLVQFCALMRARIRTNDGLYRYGGEEFAVIAMGTESVAAARFAEELRGMVAQAELLTDYPVTVSIGVAQRLPGESADDWFRRADGMLYIAKLSGRNAVRVAE